MKHKYHQNRSLQKLDEQIIDKTWREAKHQRLQPQQQQFLRETSEIIKFYQMRLKIL